MLRSGARCPIPLQLTVFGYPMPQSTFVTAASALEDTLATIAIDEVAEENSL